MATQIYPDSEGYADVYTAWLKEGKPYKLLWQGQAYVQILDNTTIYFVTVDRDDKLWLDPNDPTGRWHNAYGYMPKEGNEPNG